jgi:hypothetical protein
LELSIQDNIDLGYIPISTPAELNQIRVGTTSFIASYNNQTYTFSDDYADLTNALKRKYILTNSIDLGIAPYNSTTGWLPIGDNINRFAGEFFGNSNKVENLFIARTLNESSSDHIGLFAVIGAGAVVSDLDIEVDNISGRNDVGALAGIADTTSTIDNVRISSKDEDSTITGYFRVGGLVGSHDIAVSRYNSTPFVFTLGEDGKYHYSNEIGNILPNNLESEDYAVLNSNQLALQSDGKYYINITNEYNEIAYLDEINLVVFEHESNQEIALSSLRSDIGSINSMAKIIPTNTLPILNAINSKGNNVTDYLIARDANWTNFAKEENDYFEYFELNLGNLRNSNNVNLVYSSVRDYLLISPNRFVFDVYVGNDSWLPVAEFDAKLASSNIKRPISFPRLNILDLTQVYNGVGRPSEFIIRFGFNRVSYDYFGIAVDISDGPLSYSTINPSSGDLSYRGFSGYNQTFPYKNFDYQNLKTQTHGYYLNQSGYFTKFGDVTPLLEDKDDQFAILRYGDELKFSFDAQPVSSGLVRSYILEGAVWYKHANRVSGTTVEPIPFNGMNAYPHNEDLISNEYQLEWNTRYYAPTLNSSNTIKNSITNILVEGMESVGGLVGYNYEGTIEDSSSSGFVNGMATLFFKSGNEYIGGLVGYNNNGKILNSNSSSNVTGDAYLGGLVGYSARRYITNNVLISLIEESFATGLVQGTANSYYVGGLIGVSTNTQINYSYATGNVIGGEDSGGLIGSASNLQLNYSYATGDITSGNRTGGLIGRTIANVIITKSYSSGDVIGSEDVGGFVGYAYQTKIYDSYNLGSVTGQNRVGGLIGQYQFYGSGEMSSLISNSYNSGNVSGTTLVGGIAGEISRNDELDIVIIKSYFLKTGSINSTLLAFGSVDVPATISQATPLNANEMINSENFQNWDFATIWRINLIKNSGYPELVWQD